MSALCLLGLGVGCADAVDETASGSAEATAVELTSIAQALGPEDGDFTECRASLVVDEFNDLPPDLEIVDGRLQLASETETRPDLWVANSADNTVTRIATDTRTRVGTYATGRSPSRTAVDLNFDVIVADRAFGSNGTVTKIDGDCFCATPTTVCTACREWQVNLGSNVVPRGLAIDRNNDAWVGLYNSRRIVKLDGETGAVLGSYSVGAPVYGLAIDREGLIWAPTLFTQRVGTNNIYTGSLLCFDPETNTSCGTFTWPRTNNLPHPLYGVAVDVTGNVWLGSWDSQRMLYLDRASFDAQRGAGIPANLLNPTRRVFTPPSGRGNTRGIAVDLEGNVWLADSGANRLYRFNPGLQAFDMSVPTCSGPIGVGLSDTLEVWTMCQNSAIARAYNPAAYDGTNPPTYQRASVTVGNSPYSYSDFTGFALRNITAPSGQWRQVFECGADGCGFNWIDWEAVVPTGAGFRVQYRTSSDGVNWSDLSDIYDVAPSNVPVVVPTPRYVELILTLEVSPTDQTPKIGSVTLWQCPLMVPPTSPAVDARYIVNQLANNFAMRWAFTDASWPEQRFETIDRAGNIRCIVSSTTAWQIGDRYQGAAGATPGCSEEGHPSNTLLERAFVSARRLSDGTWERSAPSEYIAAFTNVNNPIENIDLQIVTFSNDDALIGWRRPQNNWNAGETGARVEISTSQTFNPADPSYQLVSNFSDGQRGYASPTNAYGVRTVTGLLPGTTYYVRLTYQSGDAVPSQSAVMSFVTWGGACCYLGICVGVCADAQLGPDGCEEPAGYENAELSCDGLDNDCDGLTDEGLTNACGECGVLDPEICDGIDNDCDGGTDIDPVDGTIYFRDLDGDDWGDPATSVRACSQPDGYVTRGRDCDDTNPNINPGQLDVCNNIDDDCDGDIDEDEPPQDYYRDIDGDGFGAGEARSFCEQPDGYSTNDTDCDDARANVFPGATEICDLLDNDCDLIVDEGFLNAQVVVGNVRPLDQVTGGAGVCSNSFSGSVCSTNYAVDITVTNRGTIPVPSTSTLSIENIIGGTLGGPMPLGADVAVAGSITRTYCFGTYEADEPETLVAVLAGTPANSCREFTGSRADVEFGNGVEICDGRDNDCDRRTDESPDACGVILDCLQTRPGVYECVGTLEDE